MDQIGKTDGMELKQRRAGNPERGGHTGVQTRGLRAYKRAFEWRERVKNDHQQYESQESPASSPTAERDLLREIHNTIRGGFVTG